MESLILERTKYSPKVILDPGMGYFEISGMSLPENVITFYKPIFTWLQSYLNSDNSEMILNFRMVYFNTATSKMLLSIVNILEKAHVEGKKVAVLWSYQDGDEDMLEAGKEFKDISQIPFTIQKSNVDFQ
jgi:hypothetical protein